MSVPAITDAGIGGLLERLRGIPLTQPEWRQEAGRSVAASPAKLVGALPPRFPFFTGREDLLDKLAASANRQHSTVVAPDSLAGGGGVGKTELAVEFAYRSLEARRVDWAGIVVADTSSRFIDDLAALAEHLRIPQRQDGEDAQEFAGRVRVALEAEAARLVRAGGRQRRAGGTTGRAASPPRAGARRHHHPRPFVGREPGSEPAGGGRVRSRHGAGPAAPTRAKRRIGSRRSPGQLGQAWTSAIYRSLSTSLVSSCSMGTPLRSSCINCPAIRPVDGTSPSRRCGRLRRHGWSQPACRLLGLLSVTAPDRLPVGDLASVGFEPELEGPHLALATLHRWGFIEQIPTTSGPTASVHRLLQEVVRSANPEQLPQAFRDAATLLTAALPADATHPDGWVPMKALDPHISALLNRVGRGEPQRRAWHGCVAAG